MSLCLLFAQEQLKKVRFMILFIYLYAFYEIFDKKKLITIKFDLTRSKDLKKLEN